MEKKSNDTKKLKKEAIIILNSIASNIKTDLKDKSSEFVLYDYERDNFDKELNNYKETLLKEDILIDAYENLEVISVENKSRYIIHCEDLKTGASIDFDLVKINGKLKEDNFDWLEYARNLLLKLCGRVTDEMALNAAKLIGMLVNKRENYSKRYSEIGWDIVDKALVFKYDKIYSNANIDGYYQDDFRDIKATLPENRFWTVVENIANLMGNSSFNKIILGATISGVVRQLLNYTKESSLNINITGEPASGKTTFCRYALSLFGDPDRLEGSFIDTINSVPETRVLKPVLPYVLDERMLRYFEMSGMKETRNIIMDIFREYEGRNRRKASRVDIKFTPGPLISTSVQSLKETIAGTRDLGQFRRILEFEVNKNEIFKDTDEAVRYGLLSKSEKGVGIKIIIEYLFNNFIKHDDLDIESQDIIEKLNERFFNTCRSISNKLREENIEPYEQRFALIILSYQILRESLEYKMKCLFEEMIDFNENYKKQADNLTASSEVKKIMYKDLAIERFGNVLYEKYYKNLSDDNFIDNIFETSDIYKDCTDDILGYLIENVKDKKVDVRKALIEFIEENKDKLMVNKSTDKESESTDKKSESTDKKSKSTEESESTDKESESTDENILRNVLILEEDDNYYTIKTVVSYGLVNVLLKPEIPSLDEIKEYIIDANIMDNKKRNNNLYLKMKPLRSMSDINLDKITIVGEDKQVNVEYSNGKKQRSHVIKIRKD